MNSKEANERIYTAIHPAQAEGAQLRQICWGEEIVNVAGAVNSLVEVKFQY